MAEEVFSAGLAEARTLLASSERQDRAWPSVLAALAFAVCALGFAAAAILAPPVELTPIAGIRGAN
jgi:hypothetical protein